MKKLRCQDCGYLYLLETTRRAVPDRDRDPRLAPGTVEIETVRTMLELHFREEGVLREYALYLRCYRFGPFERERREARPEGKDDAAQIFDLASKQRECRLFFRYEPGYGPQPHLELREKAEERVSARRWAAIQTLIGAAVVLLAVVVEKLL